jgi:hypothetical protein
MLGGMLYLRLVLTADLANHSWVIPGRLMFMYSPQYAACSALAFSIFTGNTMKSCLALFADPSGDHSSMDLLARNIAGGLVVAARTHLIFRYLHPTDYQRY